MSGFFKGIFGGKNEDGEVLLAPPEGTNVAGADSEELEEFSADVQGTIDTVIVASDDRNNHQDAEHGVHASDRQQEEHVHTAPATTPVNGHHYPEQPDLPATFTAEGVWNDSGVSALEQRTVGKAQQLLASLPDETPHHVKRQIVEASLKAFEVSIADIIQGASSEIAALRSYIEGINQNAESFARSSESRIADLEAEIARIRDNMRAAEEQQESLVDAASGVIDKVEPVLDFFSPDGQVAAAAPTFSVPAPATPPVAAQDAADVDGSATETDV